MKVKYNFFSKAKSWHVDEHHKLYWKASLKSFKVEGWGTGKNAINIYLENGLLFLLLPRMVVPAGPSLALSRNQLAGGSFKSVFSSRRANAVRGGAEEYFTTARLFTSLPPRNKADPWLTF